MLPFSCWCAFCVPTPSCAEGVHSAEQGVLRSSGKQPDWRDAIEAAHDVASMPASVCGLEPPSTNAHASPEKPRRKHLLRPRSSGKGQPKRSCGYLLSDDHSVVIQATPIHRKEVQTSLQRQKRRQAPARRAAMLATMRRDRSCDFFGDQRRRSADLELEARWSAPYTSSVTMLDRCRRSMRRLSVSKAAIMGLDFADNDQEIVSFCDLELALDRTGGQSRSRVP